MRFQRSGWRRHHHQRSPRTRMSPWWKRFTTRMELNDDIGVMWHLRVRILGVIQIICDTFLVLFRPRPPPPGPRCHIFSLSLIFKSLICLELMVKCIMKKVSLGANLTVTKLFAYKSTKNSISKCKKCLCDFVLTPPQNSRIIWMAPYLSR